MGRLALLAFVLAGCTPHADGSCLWVPGDDGTCGGRGGGGSDVPEPPPHVSFAVAALAPGHVFVSQGGDAGVALLRAPLDQLGMPTAELAEIPHDPTGALVAWPGPDGQALLTMTSYNAAPNPYGVVVELLEADGRIHARQTLATTIPYQVEVVFDGEAYVVAWSEWTYDEERYRLQVARVFPDGTLGSIHEPARLGADDQNSAFSLATTGLGDALLTWGVRIGWRFNPDVPLELRAVELVDGFAIAEPWVIAADGERCLGEAHPVLALVDGYHVLATRRPCAWEVEPVIDVIDLHVAAGAATEVVSTLELAPLPTRWVQGATGYLAYDEFGREAWLVDAALGRATQAWIAGPDEALNAVAPTATGFVTALRSWGDPSVVELARIDAASDERATIATEYDLPDDGCSAGGATSLAPALALLLLVRRRRV